MRPAALFQQAEKAKIREYAERILNVEQADFTPLVFTCAGGIAPKSQLVIKRLAEKISERQNVHVSVATGWLRARLSFSLLRTTLLCIRATRRKKLFIDNNIELAVSSSVLTTNSRCCLLLRDAAFWRGCLQFHPPTTSHLS